MIKSLGDSVRGGAVGLAGGDVTAIPAQPS